MTISKSAKGYLFVIAAALLWASSGAAGKGLFETGISPFDLVQIRVTIASGILLLLLSAIAPRKLLIKPADLGYLFFLGGVIMSLAQLTYFYAISKIQVVAAVLLQYLSPVIVAVYSMVFWKERLTVVKLTALIFAISGCYLVVGAYNISLLQMNRVGIMSGLAAALAYAAYALLGEKAMHKYDPWTVVFYSLFFAAVTLDVVFPPFKPIYAEYSVTQWTWICYISIFGTIFPFGLYFLGIDYLRSTSAMITATLEPITAGVMAYVFLGEKLQPPQMVGGALVLAAILLLQAGKERDSLSPDAIRNR